MRRRGSDRRYRVGPDLTGVGAVICALVIVAFMVWAMSQLADIS